MDMERINDNTIRVSIGNEDLEERGITFLDLLGNQKQIESFFYSILEEVDVDEQFQETDSVTFQVLPNQDGLELFISKNLPLDDMNNIEHGDDGLLGDSFSNFLKEHIATHDKESDAEVDEEIFMLQHGDKVKEEILRLNDFEEMIDLAKHVKLHNVLTSLYIYKEDYYLSVSFFVEEKDEIEINSDLAKLYEYAHSSNVTADILDEYGEILMDRNALELSRHYFK